MSGDERRRRNGGAAARSLRNKRAAAGSDSASSQTPRSGSSESGAERQAVRRRGGDRASGAVSSGRLRRVKAAGPAGSKKRSVRARAVSTRLGARTAEAAAAPARKRSRAAISQQVARASGRRTAVSASPQPFRRGLGLGIKIAAFSAVLVALLMGGLGIYLYGVAAERIDHLINQNGVVAAKELATFLDPFFVYSDDMDRRLELTQTWNAKLNALVADPAHEFLHIRVTPDPEGFQPPYLASSQEAPRVNLRPLAPIGEVHVREGTYSGASFRGRIRVFSAPVRATPPDAEALGTEEGGTTASPEPRVIGYAHVFVKAGHIDDVKRATYAHVAEATAVGIAIAIALSIGMSMLLVRPLKQLVADIEAVAEGDLDHRTLPRSSDEIGQVAYQFDEMTRSLRRARELEQQRQAIENELAIATEIQTKLLPERIPQIPGYDLFSFYLSAREVGGDYYDFLVIDQTHLGLVVADVSGKGIPGAMVMTMVRSLLRLASHREISPAETLRKVNRILARDIRPGMFVTALYGVLDVHSRRLTVSSAGHSPLLHYRASTATVERVNPSGMAMGFDKGRTFDDTIAEQTITLAPGDRILAYTDGVIEALDEQGNEFGIERLEALLVELADLPSKDFTDALVARLEAHRGEAEQSDDITITTLRVQ